MHCRPTTMRSLHARLAIAACLVVATVARFAWLELRPPHHDEGVNGWLIERVLQRGYYAYNPDHYHGPLYFYLLAGARAWLGHGLFELRVVTAAVGVLLCVAPLIVRRELGWGRTVAAAALLAVSPSLVYYARYAIHETLFAALGMVVVLALVRFSSGGRAGWLAIASAAFAGMVATKETAMITGAVIVGWIVGEALAVWWRARRLVVLGRIVRFDRRLALGGLGLLTLFAALHVVLFTGLFRDPAGSADAVERSLAAYLHWFDSGTAPGGHTKAWCYYLHLGARYELLLYGLAILGLISGWRDPVVRALGVIGLGTLVVYSAVPYKTPWLPIGWLALLAVPAAHGVGALARQISRELGRRVRGALVCVACLVPAVVITVRSSFVRPADADEDLAYVHTSPDYFAWFGEIEAAARRLGRDRLRVAIDHPSPWPLQWALLGYPDVHWQFDRDADILIIAASRAAEREPELRGEYRHRRFDLRTGTEPVEVYVRLELGGPR